MMGFEFGSKGPLQVREEVVIVGSTREWSLLYASDLHLTHKRAHLMAELTALADAIPLDAILLGGDLIDRRSGIEVLEQGVRRLASIAPIYAVGGNHDVAMGLDPVRSAVLRGAGQWLPDGDAALDSNLILQATDHLNSPSVHSGRATRVMVAHEPAVFPAAASAGCRVTLAGHLHGGQCVVWKRGDREYPGAFLSRWNGPRFERKKATLIVSRGVADTLPLRFRCPREVVLCRIQ